MNCRLCVILNTIIPFDFQLLIANYSLMIIAFVLMNTS